MPVLNENKSLIGIIAEYDLLEAMVQGQTNMDRSIGPFVVKNVETVNLKSSLAQVQRILKEEKVPIVVEKNKVLGVITKIDLLDFLSKQTG